MATKPAPLNTFATPLPFAATPAAAAPDPVPAAQVTDEKLRQKVFRLTRAQEVRLQDYVNHNDTTIQNVVVEGINMVLKSKGLPPI